jgi:carboxyl-terminal processing protease
MLVNSRLITLWVSLFLVGCGGGGGSSSPTPSSLPPSTPSSQDSTSAWVAGSYESWRNLSGICANPRKTSDVQGTITDENSWIRSFSNDTYLWYSDLPDVDPGLVNSTGEYFDLMKTTALSPTGSPKDRFHFTYNTEEWELLSESGISVGYGAQFHLGGNDYPRSLVVAYTESNTPASAKNLNRGAAIISIDGVDVAYGSDVDTLNAGLFPSNAGEDHVFEVRDLGASETRFITLISEAVVSDPVQNETTFLVNGSMVGYMTFNDHIATSEQQLIVAMTEMRDSAIDDLIVDLRYNGGGLLGIAAELGYMIAGNVGEGEVFSEVQFNSKHPSYDPITGNFLSPLMFPSNAIGYSAVAGQPLPTLNLSRVFIIASEGTASASEAVINGLRGVGIEVILIGDTTTGKPYGFYPTDNCGTTYFTLQFKGVNASGFGDYSDGFTPVENASSQGSEISGCRVADDFSHMLGDSNEARISTALSYIENGSCPNSFETQSQARRLSPLDSGLPDFSSKNGRIMKPALGNIL